MPSFKSKFFVFILKHRHLLEFRLKRTTSVSERTDLNKLRAQVERGGGFWGKLPKGFELRPVDINGLDAEWMYPFNTDKSKAILYFHGGGLVLGSINAHRSIVAKFVQDSGVPALLFDYALAPENPYPAGLNDSLKAYQYMLEKGIKPENIAFMGDSGGGNLVYATMLALKEKSIPLPAAAVTLSAWTDLTNSGESWQFNDEKDTLCWKDAQKIFSEYYCGDNDPKNPLISPLFGDLSGFPPLLMYAGGDEGMLSDTTRFAEKAKAAGVDVSLRIGEGLFHCYPACAPIFPEATEAKDEICAFIKVKLNA